MRCWPRWYLIFVWFPVVWSWQMLFAGGILPDQPRWLCRHCSTSWSQDEKRHTDKSESRGPGRSLVPGSCKFGVLYLGGTTPASQTEGQFLWRKVTITIFPYRRVPLGVQPTHFGCVFGFLHVGFLLAPSVAIVAGVRRISCHFGRDIHVPQGSSVLLVLLLVGSLRGRFGRRLQPCPATAFIPTSTSLVVRATQTEVADQPDRLDRRRSCSSSSHYRRYQRPWPRPNAAA